MPARKINVKATKGREYDLNALADENRGNGSKMLKVEIYEYRKGENPNPAKRPIGALWISRRNIPK